MCKASIIFIKFLFYNIINFFVINWILVYYSFKLEFSAPFHVQSPMADIDGQLYSFIKLNCNNTSFYTVIKKVAIRFRNHAKRYSKVVYCFYFTAACFLIFNYLSIWVAYVIASLGFITMDLNMMLPYILLGNTIWLLYWSRHLPQNQLLPSLCLFDERVAIQDSL